MPYVIVKRKSYSSRHIVEGLVWGEVRQLANRTGWNQVEVFVEGKVSFKGNLATHPTTDLLNALEEMGYKLISVAAFTDDEGYSSPRVIGWTMYKPINNHQTSYQPRNAQASTPTSEIPTVQLLAQPPPSARRLSDCGASGHRDDNPPSYEDALAAICQDGQIQRRHSSPYRSRRRERSSLPASPLASPLPSPSDPRSRSPIPQMMVVNLPPQQHHHHIHSVRTNPHTRYLTTEVQRRGSMPALLAPPPSAPPYPLLPDSHVTSSSPSSPRRLTSDWNDPWISATAPPSPGYDHTSAPGVFNEEPEVVTPEPDTEEPEPEPDPEPPEPDPDPEEPDPDETEPVDNVFSDDIANIEESFAEISC